MREGRKRQHSRHPADQGDRSLARAVLVCIAFFWVPVLLLHAETLQILEGENPTRIQVIAEVRTVAGDRSVSEILSQGDGEQLLRLVLLSDSGKQGPPILGQYSRDGARLAFMPRYALTHGQRYKGIFTHEGRTIEKEYLVPANSPSTPAVVDHVYPSANKLPANLLKFYIHFSKPMREGKDIFDQIEILDTSGKTVPSPWRRMEVWSEEASRLSLWIHPGRVKRGLKLREELGPVLNPGGKYSLSISGDVMDAEGQTLGKPFVKEFEVVDADRQSPLPSAWRLTSPAANTVTPLQIHFGESLDRHLCHRLIKVRGLDGTPISGKIRVDDDERSWSFVPDAKWSSPEYEVTIDSILEDLAGNTPVRLFDVDLQERQPEPPPLTLKFRVK